MSYEPVMQALYHTRVAEWDDGEIWPVTPTTTPWPQKLRYFERDRLVDMIELGMRVCRWWPAEL